MFSTTIKFHENSPNLSDQNNSHLMDDRINDLEAGIIYNPPRHLNKKMKKRKQLDALLKFRSSKSKRTSHPLSNEALLSSEDELFLPENKTTITKSKSENRRRLCNYIRNILSFCLVCIFMIVCVGLAYANIELKNEVQNLSSRVTEIENRFSNFEINRIVSTIEQIKTRLSVVERWNVSFIYERLQKLQANFNKIKGDKQSTELSMNNDEVDLSLKLDQIEQKSAQLSEISNELDKLSHDADNQAANIIIDKSKPFDRNLIERLLEQERNSNIHQDENQILKTMNSLNESLFTNIKKWNDEFQILRIKFQNLNQSTKIEELVVHFQELFNLMQNSSDKTSNIINILQSDINQIKQQIDTCGCSKESIRLKPSIVDTNQLQQNIITKPTVVETTSPSPTVAATSQSVGLNQAENIEHNNTIDISQIIKAPSSINKLIN